MWIWHCQRLNIQKKYDVLFENIMETHYESKDEKPHCYSESGKIKDLQQILNPINAFILSLLMSYAVSHFKLLNISWYRSMKPFIANLKLVIKKPLCIWHDYFIVFDYSSNNDMLNGMSMYICFYHFNTISFEFLYMIYFIKLYVLS